MDGMTPDFSKAFEKAEQTNFAKGYGQLKQICFNLFTDHCELPDIDNLTISKDMINTYSNIKYDAIIDLWFAEWKSKR